MGKNTWLVLGRILLAIPFLLAGIGKLTGFSGSVSYASSVGVPLATLAVVIALIVELAGALMLIFGYRAGMGSMVLVVYLVVVTLFFHLSLSDPGQLVQFNKNLGLIGGLLILSAFKKEDK